VILLFIIFIITVLECLFSVALSLAYLHRVAVKDRNCNWSGACICSLLT